MGQSLYIFGTMCMLQKFLWASVVICVSGISPGFILIQEDITIDYVNPTLAEASASICKFKDTANAMNLTFTLNRDLPKDTKFRIVAYRWLKTDYHTAIIQFNKLLKDALEMELFDLQSLLVEHSRPPMTWPLEKGITYNSVGWNPDTRKFPPTVPNGRYKVKIFITFPDGTDTVTATWFIKIVANV